MHENSIIIPQDVLDHRSGVRGCSTFLHICQSVTRLWGFVWSVYFHCGRRICLDYCGIFNMNIVLLCLAIELEWQEIIINWRKRVARRLCGRNASCTSCIYICDCFWAFFTKCSVGRYSSIIKSNWNICCLVNCWRKCCQVE